uniref:ADP-ribosyl-[dinitrogen reductase] hydrolase n=1 Tax=Pyrodinium bahamense TaxID=73915 RepID=A0A7S0A1A8_9DINO
MDNLSMALHCVWTTDSFKSAVLKAANVCGDADTVAAVAGQLAGAIYGASQVPKPWLEHLEAWDSGDILLKAWLLYHREEAVLSRAIKGNAAAVAFPVRPSRDGEALATDGLEGGS